MGAPPTLAQAATLRQMQAGGAQPYYPLPSFGSTVTLAVLQPFRADGDHWRGIAQAGALGLAALLLAAMLAWRAGARPSHVFLWLPAAGLAAAAAAQLLAYRFYLPDRMLQLAWIPAALLALPLLVERALRPLDAVRAPLRAALLCCALLFAAGGDGLPLAENLTDFRSHETAAIRFLATLPRDILIAAHPERASSVQVFARRRVLFSAALNMTFLYEYARELERRIEAYYRAYYARDLEGVRTLRRSYHVDYLLLDERDFGPDALRRARYYEPWGSLAAQLLGQGPPATLALAHPPADSVVFRDGTQLVVDLAALDRAR